MAHTTIEITQREWHKQDGQIGGVPSYLPTEVIIWQPSTDKNAFVGALRSRKEVAKPKIKKAWFEKAGPGRRLINLGPGNRPGNTAMPLWTRYSPLWPWSCHQQHLLRDRNHTHPCIRQQACWPWSQLWTLKLPVTQLQPLSVLVQEQSRLSRDLPGDIPVCALRDRPSDLSPTQTLKKPCD